MSDGPTPESSAPQGAGPAEDLPEDVVYWHRQANLEDVFLRLTGRQLREN